MKIKIKAVTLERLKTYSVTDGIQWDEAIDDFAEIDITNKAAKGLRNFQDLDDTEPPDYDFLLNEMMDIIDDWFPPTRSIQ